MADQFIPARLILFGQTTAGWASNNLIPRKREAVIEDTVSGAEKMKVGDGVRPFSLLPYIDASGVASTLAAVLAADNIADNSIILDNATRNTTIQPGFLRLINDGTSIERVYADSTGNLYVASVYNRDRVGVISQGETPGQTFVYIAYNPLGGGGTVKIDADSVTGARLLHAPDESGTIVTHVTKDQIEIVTGLYHSFYEKDSIAYFYNSVFQGTIIHSHDDKGIYIRFKSFAAANNFVCDLKPGVFTGNRTQVLPDKSGTFAMLSDITSQTLDQVLTVGNTALHDIIIGDVLNFHILLIQATGTVQIKNGSTILSAIGNLAGTATFGLKDPGSSFYSFLESGNISANRTITTPDNDGVIALQSDLTLDTILNGGNTSPVDIIISDGVNQVDYRSDHISGSNIIGLGYEKFFLGDNVGTVILSLIDTTLTYRVTITPSAQTANRNLLLPDRDGTVAVNTGGNYTGAAAGTSLIVNHGLTFTPSRIFVTPKDSLTGAGLTGYWIDSINASSFKIHYPSYVGVNMNFDWQAF